MPTRVISDAAEASTAPRETKAGWQVAGRVALFWMGFALLVMGAFKMAGSFPRAWQNLIGGTSASAGVFAFTAWFVRWDRLRLQNVGLAWSRGSIGRFLCGIAIGTSLFLIIAGILGGWGGVRWVRSPDVGPAAIGPTVISFLALAALEEMGFRGYPLRRLEQPLGLWGAQAVVAIAFGFSHWLQGWPWLNAFVGTGLGSLVFGLAAVATRGLALPIGLHFAVNLTDWALGGKGSPGIWKAVVAEEFRERSQWLGQLGYCGVMVAVTLGFWLWHRRASPAGATTSGGV